MSQVSWQSKDVIIAFMRSVYLNKKISAKNLQYATEEYLCKCGWSGSWVGAEVEAMEKLSVAEKVAYGMMAEPLYNAALEPLNREAESKFITNVAQVRPDKLSPNTFEKLREAYGMCAESYGSDRVAGLFLSPVAPNKMVMRGVTLYSIPDVAYILPLESFAEVYGNWEVAKYVDVSRGVLYSVMRHGTTCEVEEMPAPAMTLANVCGHGGARAWMGEGWEAIADFLSKRLDGKVMFSRDEAARLVMKDLERFGEGERTSAARIKDTTMWKPTSKRLYSVYMCRPALGTKVSNFLEGSSYVTSVDKPYVLSGTQGEQWTIDVVKLGKTYTFESGEPITAASLQAKFGDSQFDWVKITTIVDQSKRVRNWAMFLGNGADTVSLPVKTSWGETLYANREGVPHGDGDFLVCSDNNGAPNLDDMWVVNGCIFPATYDMTSFTDCASAGRVAGLVRPSPL